MYMLQHKPINILIRFGFIIAPMKKIVLYLLFPPVFFFLLFLDTIEGLSFDV